MTKTELDILRADISEISAKVDRKMMLPTKAEIAESCEQLGEIVKKSFAPMIDHLNSLSFGDRRLLGNFQSAVEVLTPETILGIVEALNQATDAEREAVDPIATWLIETLSDEKKQRLIELLQKKVGAT